MSARPLREFLCTPCETVVLLWVKTEGEKKDGRKDCPYIHAERYPREVQHPTVFPINEQMTPV
jgi:hypothetical protein